MDSTTLIVLIAAILIFVILAIKLRKKEKRPTASKSASGDVASATGGMWTVYGTDSCGWTLKQLSVFDTKGIPYNYVNCAQSDCSGMSAFPTLVSPSGVKTVGFNSLE